MIELIQHDPTIEAALRDGAWVVFNLSGGKDCGAVSAITIAYLDSIGHPRDRRLAIHADLGRAEWRFNAAQVEAQAHALGLKLVVVSAKSGDLVDRFEGRWELGMEAYRDLRLYNLRGPWSSPSLKFCQSEKKIQVMGPHLARTLKGETIINVLGIRREESTARSDAVVAKVDTRFAKPGNRAGTTMLLWQPGVEMLEPQVYAANDYYGIPLAHSYALGTSRHSCAFCIMGNINDLGIAAREPSNHWLYCHYVHLEAISTFSFQAGRWLGDIAPEVLSPGLITDLTRAKGRSADRRKIELALPARHRFVKGWPLFVPTFDEAVQIVEGRRIILGHHGHEDRYGSPTLAIRRFEELLAMKEAA